MRRWNRAHRAATTYFMNPAEVWLTGDAVLSERPSLLDFWRWAFGDQSDDDIKGIFAEWMVSVLLGLPVQSGRRISWANSDIILPNQTRIEVKASALWQSWKILNEDGTRKPDLKPAVPEPKKIRFGGLQARTAVSTSAPTDTVEFKSHLYVFCMHVQTDPNAWDAWNLAHWEFYVMTKAELLRRNVGKSITLAALREVRPAMSARDFQTYMRDLLASQQP
jgi:hypothetical protein